MNKYDNLRYIIDHIFCPPRLPQHDDLDMIKEHVLCLTVHRFVEVYRSLLAADLKSQWMPITRMLKNLCKSQETNMLSKEFIKKSMITMHTSDVVVFPIRAQNAAIILRKFQDEIVLESFEISPPAAIVMAAKGKLVCSYPGPAIAIPSKDFDDPYFREELASFLEQMNVDVLDSAAKTTKAGSTVIEERDSAHPRYITQLLTGILHGMGEVADTIHIRKRIGDDVLWNNAKNPWRRSPVWLVIRVVMQTSLCRERDGHNQYKAFMVFLMASILRQTYKQDFSRDYIFCMRAKMSRRFYKLGAAAPEFVLKIVHETGQAVEESLQEKWSTVQKEQAQGAPWAPETLNVSGDTRLSLLKSRSYLSRILQGNSLCIAPYPFHPQQSPRFNNFDAFCSNDLSDIFLAEPAMALADFELAVENDIDDWVGMNLHVESGCTTIAGCITRYSTAATKLYESSPENQSLMILTLIELWVALDKMAVAQCPLLREYSPEVPIELLEPLLLRRCNSFKRIASIKGYLEGRHRYAFWSVFTDDVSSDTFAVRYFETSVIHQSLKARIEKDAQLGRHNKLAELEEKNTRHETLLNESRTLEHGTHTNQGKFKHKQCRKCSLETEAKSLRIKIHEWPLPQDPFKARVVIFELDCPLPFGVWRTTTYTILHDICMPQQDRSADPPVHLATYKAFEKYLVHGQLSRITLASTTKPFLKSHHKRTKIPSDKDAVCVNNGLQFRLFDIHEHAWAAGSFEKSNVFRHCTPQLPANGPYTALQYAVDGTPHTSNHVMANQSECPKELHLHEYTAFASLRSGSRLQWLNIARELPTKALSFHREEVHTLLTQAAWQIGHLGKGGEWEWHVELSNREFGLLLLKEMEDLMHSIEASWLGGVTMRTITALISRLLAANNDNCVTDKAYSLLWKAGNVTFRWVHQLLLKLQQSIDEDKIREFQLRVCEMAATCRGAYDVDPGHLLSLLGSSQDVAIIIECAIYVHDNCPSSLEDVAPDLKKLLDRDRRLSHSMESLLCQRIGENREGLDLAIAGIWNGYRPGSSWKQLESPNDRWFCSMTAPEVGVELQYIQFNLLEGQLLINGKPLSRLPRAIVKHPSYNRIFGQKILDIIPADMPGMDFATRCPISGYQVYFALQEDDTQLTIRTKRGLTVLELVEHDQFISDLPALLVHNYTHWLDLSNGEIELRPLENLWKSSAQNWRIHFSDNGISRMHKEPSVSLVDIRSPTFQMISTCLRPLEDAENLIVTQSQIHQLLSVELPRFRLSFFLNSEKLLESQNMPGMVIDSNQSTGTMFGFFSQLVLRAKDPIAAQLPRSRRVIIPHGKLYFAARGDHVTAAVDTMSQRHVKYFEYHIDTDLGCLVGNVSLMSKLYKVYLHAISSHCLPDPLTGRTGTEEALHGLSSASCLSFQNLGPAETDMLRQIASLTPKRTFYPEHLEVMQRIDWSDLAPMAQHHGFFTVTQSIMDYAEQLQLFCGHSEPDVYDLSRAHSPKHAHLLDRAGRRAAVLYPADLAGLLSSSNEDMEYTCRHHDAGIETLVCDISKMVYQWPSKLNTSDQLFRKLESWEQLSGTNGSLTLSYSRDWLQQDLVQTQWLKIYDLCRQSSKKTSRFQLLFSFSALAYNSAEIQSLIPTLLAFATLPLFSTLPPPSWSYYDLSKGFKPQRDVLQKAVLSAVIPFQSSPEISLQGKHGESTAGLAKQSFNARRDILVTALIDSLIDQWPCEQPSLPSDSYSWPFDIPVIMSEVTQSFRSWFQNAELRDHTAQVQDALDGVPKLDRMCRPEVQPVYSHAPYANSHSSACGPSFISFHQLFERAAPPIDHPPSVVGIAERYKKHQNPPDTKVLRSLLSEFRCDQAHPFHRLYGNDLDRSRMALGHQTSLVFPNTIPYSMSTLTYHRDHCEKHMWYIFASIYQSLYPSNPTEMTIFTAGLWPRVTTKSLLAKLAYSSDIALTNQWKKVLISFAQSIICFQRSQRLIRWALLRNHEEFFKEMENKGYENRDAMQYIDWLLIQIDGDFIARPIQILVAQGMIAPTSERNTVLQLNMGEGKSSVIVPMAAAALADGQKLMRVIVLKSLSSQMFQLLVERLSGLVNRRIFYMPFSRTVKLDVQQVSLVKKLYKECIQLGGILVVQPEHILSFKLMGIDRLFCSTTSTDRKIAGALLECQRWLELVSRDILDESDEILHVRYQLIYTVGCQQLLEDHPDRWITVQQILALVKKHISTVRCLFPDGVEVQECPHGRFPPLRIFEKDAAALLVGLIAKDALDGGLPNYPFEFTPDHIRRATLRMITEIHMPAEDAEQIKEYYENSGAWKGLLLLRGLFAHGILAYALKEKRWRVDYGLDLSRSLLAVPYRAKDVPASRADFGHPDVSVVLTCLSYYYGGLSDFQLDLCFELLYKLDNPVMEYQNWIHDSVPEALRQLSGVNTRDTEQRDKYLFPLFQYNRAVINFYLSQVVFPKEAKQFPHKIVTSGWDIAATKTQITTGFSGTNDNRHLLPTSISQRDPIEQLSTNAKVLSYMLQPENDHYLCVQSQNGERPSSRDFLELLVRQDPEIRILLDVGAQMLEFQNAELAKHWLFLKPDVEAVVFFGDSDEPVVQTRDGTIEPFISSSFSQQLEKCLVYLDDAHTRGTDLKLPRDSRAAVTLGPKVTKDRLLQGCMRMRKLGHGQSVMFFAPLEVDRKIRQAANKCLSGNVKILDILRWAMLATCEDIQHYVPHWVQQGIDYGKREDAWFAFSPSENPSVDSMKSSWLQQESRTLEMMYGFTSVAGGHPIHSLHVPVIHERCQMLGVFSLSDIRMDEEQEREVNHETEIEHQVERPFKAEAATHQVHAHLFKFVRTGTIPSESYEFMPAFSPLCKLATAPNGYPWSPNLFATRDFLVTIQAQLYNAENYMRPVNWIMSSTAQGDTILVILSPFEVNELLPNIRKSKVVHLHQYSPRVTQAMRSFDDLRFYCIPPLPSSWKPPSPEVILQLNLWAGQLYLPDYETYRRLCAFLGVYTRNEGLESYTPVQHDGFIQPAHRRGVLTSYCPFIRSPLPFLKELVGLRRKGMSYLPTHLGKVLHARLLTEHDFDN